MLHRLDARTKLLLFLCIFLALALSRNLYSLFIIALFTLFLVIISSFSFIFILKSIAAFLWIFLFTSLFHLFFTPGDSIDIFMSSGTGITEQGAEKAVWILLQLTIMIVNANLLTLTSSPRELSLAFERLISPLNRLSVKTEELSFLFILTIRFIPILKSEIEKILLSRKARGITFSGSLSERASNIASVIPPVFSNIFYRSDHLVTAIISRGFGRDERRGRWKESSFRWNDLAAFVIILALLVFISFT